MLVKGLVICFLFFSMVTEAAVFHHAPLKKPEKITHQLTQVRDEILKVEKSLIRSLKKKKRSRREIRQVRTLMDLQKKESDLVQKKILELKRLNKNLIKKRKRVILSTENQKKRVRNALIEIHRSIRFSRLNALSPELEIQEAPRREVLSNLVAFGHREVAQLQADLEDASRLETQIQEQKNHLAYLKQEIQEKQSLAAFHRRLERDILKERYQERLSQIQKYRELKDSEETLDGLLKEFNARMELKALVQSRRKISSDFLKGKFLKAKGTLSLPVSGKIVSRFGRQFDPLSKLYVFRKGVEIEVEKDSPIKSIYSGRIAYSGKLPGYGRVVIVEHGAHYYSLVARLSELRFGQGDWVAKGDSLGLSNDAGAPIYFEIRARNVAVNPLQWVTP